MGFLNNNQGFTLLSMLMTLVVTMIILPIITSLIISLNTSSSYDELSVQQFFIFLRDELIEATDYDVTQKQLVLYLRDGKEAIFEQYEQLVVRRIDGGYEVYLRDISDLSFTKLAYGIKATVISLEGVAYEKTIVFYE